VSKRHGRAGWLVDDSEIAELIRSKDWSQTQLGPIECWPESLQTTVSLCLASSFPINLIWGPGYVQIWNEAYSHICGEKHPGMLGSDYRECWASAWPAIGAAFDTACAGETAFLENQPMFLDRNGYLEETWFTFSLSPIRDETGEVVGLFHPVTETTQGMLSARRTRCLRDLSSRAMDVRSVEQATALSLDVLSWFVPELPFLLLYMVDEDAGARLVGHTGLDAGHAISPPVINLACPAAGSAVADVLRTGEMSHVTDLRTRFGEVHAGAYEEPLEQALLLPLTLPGLERPAGVLAAGVSTRLPLDETYRGFFDLVAAGVTSVLASATAYEQERSRAEALAEIDRAKTAFFSNVSHEFRTPLTLMLGPLEEELADAQALEPLHRERLETAHRNSLRLLRLVNSLLDFSRIESGRVLASYLPTDLAACTTDLVSLFRSATDRAGLELIVDCDALPEPVLVDREMWEKIVLNLLSNAFKHTFEGTITVTLRWREDSAELSVTDTGVGIAAQELPRLFERFHRVKDARSRSIEGTGIGLALVRELAQLHGGDVRVESEEGQGSRFTVSVRGGRAHLPADQVHDASDAPSASGFAAAHVDEALNWLVLEGASELSDTDGVNGFDGGEPATRRARVLLADDNKDMRRHIQRLLESRFDVTAVGDGAAALQSALREPPDLVLTDVMMPRLDGFGLVAALRDHDQTRTIPVIMLSARAGEEAAVEGIGAGADDYLVKPFSARELMARVCGCIALAGSRRQAAEQLEEANRELASAARTKSEFVANMSHELRTPLNAILGFTGTLLMGLPGPLNDEQTKQLRTVQSNGKHLLSLINDMLDLAKIESGRVELNVESIDCHGLMEEVIVGLRPLAEKKGLQLETVAGTDRFGVHTDRRALSQILINLANNAIKFTDQGSVRLGLSRQRNDGASVTRFTVTDTGRGIKPEDQKRLFAAFQRIESPTTGSDEGTGLGLNISQTLAGTIGAAITFESEYGKGSAFTLELSE
jgi:signal transduction histidine kinase